MKNVKRTKIELEELVYRTKLFIGKLNETRKRFGTFKFILVILLIPIASPICCICSIVKYIYDKLFNISIEEAKDIVTKTADYFISIISRQLDIKEDDFILEIKEKRATDFLGYSNCIGFYGPKDSILNIWNKPYITLFYGNIYKVSNCNKMSIILKTFMVLSHELRHLWQDKKSLIEKHEKNLSYEAYLNLSHERDARKYAIKSLFYNCIDLIKFIITNK